MYGSTPPPGGSSPSFRIHLQFRWPELQSYHQSRGHQFLVHSLEFHTDQSSAVLSFGDKLHQDIFYDGSGKIVACENIRLSSLFAAGETSPAAKSEEKRMFSQARKIVTCFGSCTWRDYSTLKIERSVSVPVSIPAPQTNVWFSFS